MALIDIDRAVCYLIREHKKKKGGRFLMFLCSWIEGILEEQGLKCLDDEIIRKDTEPRFKEGDWVIYECGEEKAVLRVKSNKWKTYEFTDGSTINQADEDCLRPADPDEIPSEEKCNSCKGCHSIAAGGCDGCCKESKESPNNEMDEFENVILVAYDILDANKPHLTPCSHHIKKAAKKVFSTAEIIIRKKIASEVESLETKLKEEWLGDNASHYQMAQGYDAGYSDAIKVIKEQT